MSSSHPTPSAASSANRGLEASVLLLMAIASGLCAGGNYFNQPLLHSIALDFGVSETTAALTVTAAQVSYACGLVLLVPLGDKFERRRLAVTLMLLAGLGQFISGFAASIHFLFAGIMMAGMFSVAAQILVPLAAILSDPSRSGRAVGLVMSGLLLGILAARSVAGILSSLGGWHTVYRLSSITMVVVALLLWRKLPTSRNPAQVSYGEVLRSMGVLMRRHPRLLSRALMSALAFASVSALFSTMALLLSGPSHGLSDASIGLVGLAGVAGALMANVAGRCADRGWTREAGVACVLLLLAGWGCFWLGETSLAWFIVGMLVIDLGLQGLHITNQHIVFELEPEARSRMNAVYMTTYFIGAASGSALGSLAWLHGGWPTICVLGIVLALLCGALLIRDERSVTVR